MINHESYRGNTRLLKPGVLRKYTKEEVLEFEKCKADPIYFAKNYMMIISVDKKGGLMNFPIRSYQEKMIDTFWKNRFTICKLPRQYGKAIDLEEDILTTKGFIKFRDIKVGDMIYGKNGKPTKVIMVTPVMFDHDCYEIEFDDGTTVKCDAEHLWEINCSWWNKSKVLNTLEIIEQFKKTKKSGSGLYINLNEKLEFNNEENLPIDPYVLGLWLGDGNSYDSRITCHDKDFDFYKKIIPNIEYFKFTKDKEHIIRFKIKDLFQKLKSLDLIKNKHIPQQYINSSIENRLNLVKGLMDTDGWIGKNSGQIEFYQKDEVLLDDVNFILRSLGIKTRKSYKTIKGSNYFCLRLFTNLNLFLLPRKLERQKTHIYSEVNKKLYIKNITKIDSRPVKCIKVDNEDHLFLIGKNLIPTHNSTTVIAFFLWYILFHKGVSVAILANKASTSRELLYRLKLAYEYLPNFLKQGIISWNKGDIELANRSKIIAASTSADSIRGGTYNMILLDEFAHVPDNIAEEFFNSVYPTITSGESSKIIIVSTPKGMNMFYTIWKKAEAKKNQYVPINIHWTAWPGRDERWKQEQIANTSEEQFKQEFETEFLGSADTLISAMKLEQLFAGTIDPIYSEENLKVFEHPKEKHTYTLTVDTSEGLGQDYHAFSVIDVTQIPYKLVARYRDNKISDLVLPSIIFNVANKYNEAFVLVEIKSTGQQVANILHYEFGYENLIKVEPSRKVGQTVTPGFKKQIQLGIKTSVATKRIGCTNLKSLIENDKLIIKDETVIREFTTFSVKNQSYQAEENNNDDLVMTLVLFGWLSAQKVFKETINQDIRKVLQEENMKIMDEDIIPPPVITKGTDEEFFQDSDGDIWVSDLKNLYPPNRLDFSYYL